MHPVVAQHIAGIAAICQRHGIRRLEVFGSAVRATDFDLAHSDVDFLVEFSPTAPTDLHRFFSVKTDLENLIGRKVDLVEAGAIRNPFVLADINRSRQGIYAA